MRGVGKRCFILLLTGALTLLPVWLSGGCASEPTDTALPTVIAATPTPTPTADLSPTPQPSDPSGHVLTPLADYGALESGHTLLLPGGQWYDAAKSSPIENITDMLIDVDGTGKPTISQPAEEGPVLTLTGCSAVTFKNIRFGYDRSKWATGTQAAGMPALLELAGCSDIRFEHCEFFGGAGAGIFINESEKIVFEDCQFYNLAGDPLQTGTSYLPSQINCSNCTFETITSGPVSLYLRSSRFEHCVWTGRNGYAVPCFSEQVPAAADDWAAGTLPALLTHVLAERIDYHADENQAIVCVDNLFCSEDLYNLYQQLTRSLPELLPDNLQNWALSGQKQDEIDDGGTLDPSLGLRLDLRVTVPDPVTPAPASSATTASGKVLSSTSGTTSGPAAAESLYNLDRLLADLRPLSDLDGHLDSLITGTVSVCLSDQNQQDLLSCTIPVKQLKKVLSSAYSSILLEEADIRLNNEQIVPAHFYGRDSAGQLTARDLTAVLGAGFGINRTPLLLYPSPDETRFIEQNLEYDGTSLINGVARHDFQFSIQCSGTESNPAAALKLLFARISVRADNGAKTDLTAGQSDGRAFLLATDEQKSILLNCLRQPLSVTRQATGSGEETALQLQALTVAADPAGSYTPVMIYDAGDSRIEAKIALYDQAFQVYPVIVVLQQTQGVWQVQSAVTFNITG
ncbi:MAG: right-handed parallel beta-helix repeat-containing protein [Clostridiaceae bacterium]|nr:right-handed parallel beta-helix repeat-containing protein [Clostridiaceae bacterium]